MKRVKDDRTKYQALWDWALGVIVAGQEPFYIYHEGNSKALHQICQESGFWREVERVENLVWGPVVND